MYDAGEIVAAVKEIRRHGGEIDYIEMSEKTARKMQREISKRDKEEKRKAKRLGKKARSNIFAICATFFCRRKRNL
jgi:glycosylphosphatidylinositol transamidase (GPIT) subunit GPI8